MEGDTQRAPREMSFLPASHHPVSHIEKTDPSPTLRLEPRRFGGKATEFKALTTAQNYGALSLPHALPCILRVDWLT